MVKKNTPYFFPKCILYPALPRKCRKINKIRTSFTPKSVFVNIPYISSYASLEIAIWLTLKFYGYEPIFARDERTIEIRLCRICRMILSSDACVTDFTERRLNVAVEYGLAIAAGKMTALLIDNKFDVDIHFSDRKSIDPIGHNADPKKLILSLGEWIESNLKKRQKRDTALIVRMYDNIYKLFTDNYTYENIKLFYYDVSLLLSELELKEMEELRKIRKDRIRKIGKITRKR